VVRVTIRPSIASYRIYTGFKPFIHHNMQSQSLQFPLEHNSWWSLYQIFFQLRLYNIRSLIGSNFFTSFNKEALTIKLTPFSCFPLFFPNIVIFSDLRLPDPGHRISCKPAISTLYRLIAFITHCRAPGLYKVLIFHVPNFKIPAFPIRFPSLLSKLSIEFRGFVVFGFLTIFFYKDGSLARR